MHPKKRIAVHHALWVVIVAFACGGGSARDHWDDRVDEEVFYAIPEESPGHAQSPINILSDATAEGHHVLRFGGETHARAKTVAYTGHTVRVDFQDEELLRFDDRLYSLKQCHFHTPSEHQIDGVTYPMEMHCVAERLPEPGEAEPDYLVLGYLFRMGHSSPMVATLIDGHPHEGETRPLAGDAPVSTIDLLSGLAIAGHFYTYEGSLTTPPYSETVRWVIDKEIREASPKEIATLNALEGDNARHVQSPHGRRIESE
ncbi:MAG TPA: carbonic anhydrase family protein [Myxococcota bacterium]|nr:carbonic anhydrase family protein [Myxococcota bacterium]